MSVLKSKVDSIGNAGSTYIILISKLWLKMKAIDLTFENSTAGFLPRHKLDKHQTALRIIVNLHGLDNIL